MVIDVAVVQGVASPTQALADEAQEQPGWPLHMSLVRKSAHVASTPVHPFVGAHPSIDAHAATERSEHAVGDPLHVGVGRVAASTSAPSPTTKQPATYVQTATASDEHAIVAVPAHDSGVHEHPVIAMHCSDDGNVAHEGATPVHTFCALLQLQSR